MAGIAISGEVLTCIQRETPVNGDTIVMQNVAGTLYLILAPATDLSMLNLVWPTAPENGSVIKILSSGNISTLVHSGNVLNIPLTSITKSGSVEFVYDSVGLSYMNSDFSANVQMVSVPFTMTVAGGAGQAVVYPTDTGLVTGNALFSSIKYIHRDFNIADPNYASSVAVSTDRKTITASCKVQSFSGVTVLGINVIGSAVLNNAANGTVLNILILGVLA